MNEFVKRRQLQLEEEKRRKELLTKRKGLRELLGLGLKRQQNQLPRTCAARLRNRTINPCAEGFMARLNLFCAACNTGEPGIPMIDTGPTKDEALQNLLQKTRIWRRCGKPSPF